MIIWKKIDVVTNQGKVLKGAGTVMLPFGSGELLLRQILAMPREGKKKINLTQANDIAYAYIIDCAVRYVQGIDGKTFENQHIQWLSDQGYWIELDGSEYQFTRELPLQ